MAGERESSTHIRILLGLVEGPVRHIHHLQICTKLNRLSNIMAAHHTVSISRNKAGSRIISRMQHNTPGGR